MKQARKAASPQSKTAGRDCNERAGLAVAPVCRRAFAQIRFCVRQPQKICEEHLQGRYNIEVIDLLEQPQLAAGHQIVATPTLVRKLPEPLRKIVGDLRNTERTLVGLQLKPADWKSAIE